MSQHVTTCHNDLDGFNDLQRFAGRRMEHARPQVDARRHRRWAKPRQGTGIWCPQRWKCSFFVAIFVANDNNSQKINMMISKMLPSQVHHEIWNRYQLSHESHGARSICPGRSSPGKALSIALWVSEEADDPLKRNQAMGAGWKSRNPQLMVVTIMGNYGILWENSDKPLE